ncbi:hypothetical protein A9R05_15615 [Burkholderia sp. KK1]|nr:hypothetical protein A9R05_15615 [Burkholderia sp. KK1]
MKKAIIIDDALLPPSRTRLVALRDEIVRVGREEDALSEWFKTEFKLQGDPATDGFWDPLFESDAELSRLWDRREKSPLGTGFSKEVFGALETDIELTARPLMAAKEQLEAHEYVVTMRGTIPESVEEAIGVEIIVIDYIIDAAVGVASAKRSTAFLAELLSQRQSIKENICPFVFLVSTTGNFLTENAPQFRAESTLPESFFRFVEKDGENGFRAFKWQLSRYIESREVLRSYYAFQRSYVAALKSAYDGLLRNIEGLEVTDLATLQTTQLEEEKKPIGEYLAWLSGAYLQAKISEDQQVPATGHEIPQAKGFTYVGHLGPSDHITRMFANVAVHRPGSVAHRAANDLDIDLRFGDIFFTEAQDGASIALLVISQTCDILQQKLGGSVLMLEGRVSQVGNEPLARFRVTVEQVKFENVVLLRHGDSDYRVQWDSKRVRTVSEVALRKQKNYTYVGQLNTIYALQAQGLFLQNTGRIGVPIRPMHQSCYTNVKIRVVDEKANVDWEGEHKSHVWAVVFADRDQKLQVALTPELCILVRQIIDERRTVHTNQTMLDVLATIDEAFSSTSAILTIEKSKRMFEKLELNGKPEALNRLKLKILAEGIAQESGVNEPRRIEIKLEARV